MIVENPESLANWMAATFRSDMYERRYKQQLTELAYSGRRAENEDRFPCVFATPALFPGRNKSGTTEWLSLLVIQTKDCGKQDERDRGRLIERQIGRNFGSDVGYSNHVLLETRLSIIVCSLCYTIYIQE